MAKIKVKPHKIYAILNQKGGAGKSTTAGHFAYWLHQNEASTLFIDADGQQSATLWMEALQMPVIAMNNPELLFEKLPLLATEYDAIVVDGPGNASEITKAILGVCDMVLIPNRPSDFDLRSSGTIVQFIKHVRKMRGELPLAGFFLNAAKGERSILLREARQALQASSIPLFETVIYDLACITDSPGQQQTVFQMKGSTAAKAATAYDALFHEVLEILQ